MKLSVIFWQLLKKASLFPILLALVLLTSTAGAKTPVHAPNDKNAASPQVSVEPSATFKNLWIDYDILQGGIKGMRIHVNFTVYNMKGIPGYLAIYFQRRDGTPLNDNNGKFDSEDGTVAVYREIAPGYQTTAYDDYTVFMPYDELDLPDGDHSLRMDVDVIYKEGGLVAHLTNHDFVYNQGKKKPTVMFERVWVDYDVTQGGRLGMRVHLKFNVKGMKGVPGYAAIYFQKKNGDKLFTNNRSFRSKDGQVAIYYDINPAYDPAYFDDAQLFMPYDELNLTRGRYDLQMDIDLIYENGDLIEHMAFSDFVYTKN